MFENILGTPKEIGLIKLINCLKIKSEIKIYFILVLLFIESLNDPIKGDLIIKNSSTQLPQKLAHALLQIDLLYLFLVVLIGVYDLLFLLLLALFPTFFASLLGLHLFLLIVLASLDSKIGIWLIDRM